MFSPLADQSEVPLQIRPFTSKLAQAADRQGSETLNRMESPNAQDSPGRPSVLASDRSWARRFQLTHD